MNRVTATRASVLAVLLPWAVAAASRPQAGGADHPGTPPIVSATIAVVPMGVLPAGVGIQGLSLNGDRTRLYVGEGHRTTAWNPFTNRCQGGGVSPSPGTGALGVFDTNTLARIDDLRLADGFPIHVELDAATGRIYTATSPDWVYGFEGTTQVSAARPGGVPHDIGIDHLNGRGVVTNTAGPAGQVYVTLVDMTSLATIQQTDTGGFGPHKAAVDAERHLVYVSHADYSKVSVIDTTTGALLRQITTGLSLGGAQNAIDLARRRLYVVGASPAGTSAQVQAIDLVTEIPVGQGVHLPFGGHGMRVDSATGLLWVVLEEQGQVTVIDPDSMTERARIPVGHCPYMVEIDPVRRRAYVTNQGDNTVSVLDMTAVPDGSAAPANLTAAAITGNTVTLSWTAPPGPAPTGYVVEGGVSPGQVSGSVPTGSADTRFTFTAPTGAFYVRVHALYGSDRSAASNEIRIFVNVTAPPSAPVSLLGAVSGSSLALSWRNTSGGGTPTGTLLNVSGPTSVVLSLPPGETFSYAGVPPGTYTFTVSAMNASGSSGPSNAVTLAFLAPCTGVPGAPANFAVARSGNTVSVSWDPSATGPAVAGFVVNVTGAIVTAIPTTQRSLSGSVGPGSYTLSVAATNFCGTGPSTGPQGVVVP